MTAIIKFMVWIACCSLHTLSIPFYIYLRHIRKEDADIKDAYAILRVFYMAMYEKGSRHD